jgi:hypothetical protein
MTSRQEVFFLLHSLNEMEKKQLFQHLTAHRKDSVLAVLGRLMLEQTQYDEAAIKKALAGQKMVNQLAVAKIALRDAILDFLYRGRSEAVEVDVHQLAEKVRILMDRGVEGLAYRLVVKAKTIAAQNDLFHEVLELIRLQARMLRSQTNAEKAAALRALWQEEDQVMQWVHTESRLRRLHDELFLALNEQAYARNPATLNRCDEIVLDPLLQNPPIDLPFSLKNIYHQAWGFYAALKGLPQLRNRHFEGLVLNWEAHPRWKGRDPERYALNHIGYVETFLQLGDMESAREQLQKMKAAGSSSKRQASLAFYFTSYLELAFFRVSGAWISGGNVPVQVEEGMEVHRVNLSESIRLSLMFELGLHYFIQRKWEGCLSWTNEIINLPRSDVRTDIRGFAPVLRMLVHWELGHEDWVEYESRAALRRLGNGRASFDLERAVARSFLKALGRPVEEQREVFGKLKVELGALPPGVRAQTLGLGVAEKWLGNWAEERWIK